MKQRNTKERSLEMAKRSVRRIAAQSPTVMIGVSADINPRTNKPHEHARSKARNLKRMQNGS